MVSIAHHRLATARSGCSAPTPQLLQMMKEPAGRDSAGHSASGFVGVVENVCAKLGLHQLDRTEASAWAPIRTDAIQLCMPAMSALGSSLVA